MQIPCINKAYRNSKNEISYHLRKNSLFKLRKIVIKITLKCIANCIACKMRREKYEEIIRTKEKAMQLTDYEKLLNNAKEIGLERVTLSGGEPTICKDCIALINIIKNKGLYCMVNTNGFNLGNIADQIAASGVDEIIVSLDSLQSDVHNRLRRCQGLWERAVESIKKLNLLREKKQSKLKITIRSILTKYFIIDLDKLIDFALLFNIDSWQLDYVEADYEHRLLLPSENDIQTWRRYILPVTIQKIKSSRYAPEQKSRLIASFRKLFYFSGIIDKDISQGIYHRNTALCDYPECFALIYPNGDVWPCIGLDYRRDCLMGNLFVGDIKSIFNSERYYNFRKKGTEWCRYCPNDNTILDIN